MNKKLRILGAALTVLLVLSACAARPVTTPAQQEPPMQHEQTEQPAPAAQEAPAWSLDPERVTDAFAVETLIRLPELALSGLSFTFDTPQELNAQQLYLLFLAWAEPEELTACFDTAAGVYVFSADVICRTLDQYLEGYSLDISGCPLYDAGRGAVVTAIAGGFGGNVEVDLESKTFDSNTVVLTALLDESVRKTYTISFYDGGYRYLSVEQHTQPQLRPAVGTMLLHGEETEAFAAVTDEEICLWDAASGGQLLAVARFPSALPGAKDALRNCDFTDLDDDGCSDLTADFAFAGGSAASLLWFYTDGSLVYNQEFSVLPGDAPNAGAE